jgi:hypothetical protein
MAGFILPELPAATSGVPLEAKRLSPFGQLRLAGRPAAPLSEGAKGVVLAVAGNTKVAEVLAEARDGDKWRPLAVLVAGGAGPFFPLPEITPAARVNPKVPTATLTVAKKESAEGKDPEFEIVVREGQRLNADAAGLNELQAKVAQFTVVNNLPVKLVPHGEMPLALLVSIVDTCLKSRAQLDWMNLDPSVAVPGSAPAPAPAGEGEKKE